MFFFERVRKGDKFVLNDFFPLRENHNPPERLRKGGAAKHQMVVNFLFGFQTQVENILVRWEMYEQFSSFE